VEVVRDVDAGIVEVVDVVDVVDVDYECDCIEHGLGGNYQKVPNSNIDPDSRWVREWYVLKIE
jgi:hypothetical protein